MHWERKADAMGEKALKTEKNLGAYFARLFNKTYNILTVKWIEKSFSFGVDEVLHYLLFRRKSSDVLIVGFQAFNKKGAFYNYIGTLRKLKVNKLFIKDDFASDGLGDYYLGHNKRFDVERAVFELINETIEQCRPKTLIFIGSSKGGYAALNFGIEYPGANIIVAAPQYYLGTYLAGKKSKAPLTDILGNCYTEEDIRMLDNRLKEKILKKREGKPQRIFLHYSPEAEAHDGHAKGLVKDIKQTELFLAEDIQDYPEHWQLKFYFPQYLADTVKDIMAGK